MKPTTFALALATALTATHALAGLTGSPTPTDRVRDLGQGQRLASECSGGMSYCSPGSYGPGGCYRPGYATCTAGLVCTGGMTACKPSNGGAAYCYKQGFGTCN